MKHWREGGARLLLFFYDFMFMSPSFGESLELAARILRDFMEAGFVVNLEKSMLQPSQSITQLGCRTELTLAVGKPRS